MSRILTIVLFAIINSLYAQEYCAGNQISPEHQDRPFNVCYGECGCDQWSLSEYSGDIIFIDMSATWCAPCFSSIDFIDELEEYWSRANSNVKFVTALSDIDQPYSCQQWGNEGVIGSPLIIEDDGTMFNWFHDSNAQFPNYVIIDHEMRVRAKPSNVLENSNTDSCDGSADPNVSHSLSDWEGGCINDFIIELLDECGADCLDNNVESEDTNLASKGDLYIVEKVLDPVNDTRDCPPSYVEDCVDDDCCPEHWIGDGFSDCEDQAYGCDLTCYEQDGGDCNVGCTNNAACNYDESSMVDDGSCIVPDAYYNCCGECIAEYDCLDQCGGDATEEECNQDLGGCPSCLIVCPEDDITCQQNNNAANSFTSIQAAIDYSESGDTVLVEPGIYYENLIIQKSITLISRAVFDDLSSWMDYEDGYVVANDNINNTVLNGSANTTGNENFQSVLLINTPINEECITPTIAGFTITEGNGTLISTDEASYRAGGGYYSLHSQPTLLYNSFINNIGNEEYAIYAGGAGKIDFDSVELNGLENQGFVWSSSDPNLFAECESRGDIDLAYNAYSGNSASYGNTVNIANDNCVSSLNMSSSFFDVFNCPDDNVTSTWVYTGTCSGVDYANSVGDECSISDDVYVHVDGDDSNEGITESQAFKTIKRALEMIAPKYDNPIEIKLASQTYAPSNGYTFPIIMISNTSLVGQGEELTILDAEETGKVISVIGCNNISIEQLSITGGVSAYSTPNNGAGIYIYDSKYLNIDNVNIYENYSVGNNGSAGSLVKGIGIYANLSEFTISHSKLTNNYALDIGDYSRYGGGMYIGRSIFTMNSVFIRDNVASIGGGLYIEDIDVTGTTGIIKNSVIYGNRGPIAAGGIQIINSDILMDNVDIKNNGIDAPANSFSTGNQGMGGALQNNSLGGGIVAIDSDLSIKKSRISENWSNTVPGILIQSGTLVMQNSVISENRSWSDNYSSNINVSIYSGSFPIGLYWQLLRLDSESGEYIPFDEMEITNFVTYFLDPDCACLDLEDGGAHYNIGDWEWDEEAGALIPCWCGLRNTTLDWTKNVIGGQYKFMFGSPYSHDCADANAAISVNGEYVGSVVIPYPVEFNDESGLYESAFYFDIAASGMSANNSTIQFGLDDYAITSLDFDLFGYSAPSYGMFVNCTFANNLTPNEIGGDENSIQKIRFINSILGGDSVYNGGGSIAIISPYCEFDNNHKLEIWNSNLAEDGVNIIDGDGNNCNSLGYPDDYYNEINENIFNHDPLFVNHDWTIGSNCSDCEPLYYPNYDPGNYSLQDNSDSKNVGISNLSQFSYQGMAIEDIMTYSGSAPDLGYIENCESGELDLCGVCGGDNSFCMDCNGVIGGDAYVDDCAICDSDPTNDCTFDECGILGGNGGPCIGDPNQDNVLNVLDVIIMIEIILCGAEIDSDGDGYWESTCNEIYLNLNVFNEADYTGDGSVDISDIIALLADIFNRLGRSFASVDEINIMKSNEGLYLESGGLIALDLIISHEPNFDYLITNNALISQSRTSANLTRMIIVDPTSNILFETEDKYDIEKIEVVSVNGKDVIVNMVDSIETPREFSLSYAYPNPFNPSTTFEYYISHTTNISIAIYDLKGRQVTSLVNGIANAGYHSITWNANNQSSGIYFIKMHADSFIETQKLMLIK